MAQKNLLAADLGGIKANRVLFTIERGLCNHASEESLSNGKYDSFDELLQDLYSLTDAGVCYFQSKSCNSWCCSFWPLKGR